MFGSTVAVTYLVTPAMCMGDDNPYRANIIATTMFANGLVTLLQTTIGIRLPIIQGGTFSYLIPTLTILQLPEWSCPVEGSNIGNMPNVTTNGSINDSESKDLIWLPRMREIQGAIAIAALSQVILGATGIVGSILRYVTPLTIAPTITLIGLSLLDHAVEMASKNWAISASTIVLLILFSQYLRNVSIPSLTYTRGKGCGRGSVDLFKLFPVLMALISMWIICVILTEAGAFSATDPARTDLRNHILSETSWIGFPYPFQWGKPTVSLTGVISMLAAAVATFFESIGNYYACARLSGAVPPPTHAINRGILFEGLGSVLTAIWGTGNGTTSYAENIGAIGITKVGSRRAVQVAAIVMIIFGIITKLGALFVSIPDPIVGGLFCVMFSMLAAVGLSNIQFVDLNSSRNLFILGFSIFFGLGFPAWVKSHPDAIKTGSATADQIINVVFTTSMLVGGLIGFILDNTIPGTAEERGLTWLEEEIGDIPEGDQDPDGTYDFPIGMAAIRRWKWTRYIPFSPTFTGDIYSCCKRSKPVKKPQLGNTIASNANDHGIINVGVENNSTNF